MANILMTKASIAANATPALQLNVEQHRTFIFDLTGTFVGTIQVQTAIDSSNPVWRNVTGSFSVINAATGQFMTSGSVTSAGTYQLDVSGVSLVRVISTAYTSGTMVLVGMATPIGNQLPIGSTNVVSGTVTSNQGTLASGSVISVVSTASSNLSFQKASAGNLFELSASNPTATAAYVKLYNKATAPVVATDVPILTIPLAAGATQQLNFGELGKRFTTGIAMAITGLAPPTDATAAVAGVQVSGTYI